MRINSPKATSPKPEKPVQQLNQRALELQINTVEEGVEDEPGSSSLGEELGFPQGDFNSPSCSQEFDARKPNPSPNHKLHPSVKTEQVRLPEHDVTDVTSLHSLEEGFDSAKPTPTAPYPKPCCQDAEPTVVSHCNRIDHFQGKISNHPKENKTENVLKMSLMGSEIKFSEEGVTYCGKSLDLLEGEELIPLPTPTCGKITGRCGRQWASSQCMGNSWCALLAFSNLIVIKYQD